jgi:hypothetical protein
MARLEKFSEAEFYRDVAILGGEALKQNAAINTGVPDRLVWLPKAGGGVVWFWAEWKREGEPPSAAQLVYHKKLIKAGHMVFVFDSNSHARSVMRGLIGAI